MAIDRHDCPLARIATPRFPEIVSNSRAGRRRDQLYDIAEALESALAARTYAR